jgi:hypothetical protein
METPTEENIPVNPSFGMAMKPDSTTGNILLTKQEPELNPNIQRTINTIESEKFCLEAAFCEPFPRGADKMESPVLWAVAQINQLLQKAEIHNVRIVTRREDYVLQLELQHHCWVDKSTGQTHPLVR